MNKRKSLAIIFLIIIIDQLTKFLMIGKQITLIPGLLQLKYAQNTGMAFGLGSNKLWLITIINITVIIILIYVLIKYKLAQIPLTLIISGAISNLIDRIFKGYVIDFVKVELFDFPTFNIADIFIVLGTILLIIFIIKGDFKYGRKKEK